MNNKTVPDQYFADTFKDETSSGRIGWFCTYAPEELIIAAGFQPVRILGEKKLKSPESYFPINFCPYLKTGWTSLMQEGSSLSGVIFTNSCDGMRRLYDTAEQYLKDVSVFMLDVPRNTDSCSLDFYSLRLGGMLEFLEGIRGQKIDDDRLRKAVSLCDRKRKALQELGNRFFSGDGSLDAYSYYRTMEIASTAGARGFTESLERLMDLPKKTKPEDDNPGIMVVGNFITEARLWKMFSDLDMDIVADDLCISGRYYAGAVDAPGSSGRGEILDLLAQRYLRKPACMRMTDVGGKIRELEQKASGNDVQGVIFISLKFCDTMLYSFPLLRKKLAGLKIPVLYLEIEYNNFSEGQVKTRIQAFLEML